MMPTRGASASIPDTTSEVRASDFAESDVGDSDLIADALGTGVIAGSQGPGGFSRCGVACPTQSFGLFAMSGAGRSEGAVGPKPIHRAPALPQIRADVSAESQLVDCALCSSHRQAAERN